MFAFHFGCALVALVVGAACSFRNGLRGGGCCEPDVLIPAVLASLGALSLPLPAFWWRVVAAVIAFPIVLVMEVVLRSLCERAPGCEWRARGDHGGRWLPARRLNREARLLGRQTGRVGWARHIAVAP